MPLPSLEQPEQPQPSREQRQKTGAGVWPGDGTADDAGGASAMPVSVRPPRLGPDPTGDVAPAVQVDRPALSAQQKKRIHGCVRSVTDR
jgi:hypothetical protein